MRSTSVMRHDTPGPHVFEQEGAFFGDMVIRCLMKFKNMALSGGSGFIRICQIGLGSLIHSVFSMDSDPSTYCHI